MFLVSGEVISDLEETEARSLATQQQQYLCRVQQHTTWGVPEERNRKQLHAADPLRDS
jgi:hypothetical protein